MAEKRFLFNFEWRVVGTDEWKKSTYRDENHSSWAAFHAKAFLNDSDRKGITVEVREVTIEV